jgi:hypothetical protein
VQFKEILLMTHNRLLEFSQDLTNERLNILCDHILDTIHDSIADSSNEDDTAWTKGCLPYGRMQGLLKRLVTKKQYSWLTLANNTMDFTAKVGSAHIQFVIDDPYNPKKVHRLHTNSVENMQLSIALEEHETIQVVAWRLFVTIDKNNRELEPTATLVGFDLNQNELCRWEYNETIKVPVHSPLTVAAEIEEPELQLKKRIAKTNE